MRNRNRLFLLSLAIGYALLPSLGFCSQEADVLAKLANSGFRCESRTGGTQCVGSIDPYPEPVAVIVPQGFAFSKRLLVHLHGYVTGIPQDKTFSAILEDFKFASLLKQAHVTGSLLIVPSSRGHCETYLDYFGSSGGMERLLTGTSRATGLSLSGARVTVSGHSGAFQPIALILQGTSASRIDRVALLDATYSSIDVGTFEEWIRGDSSRKLRAVFRAGTGTENGARSLWNTLGSGKFSTSTANSFLSGRGILLPASGSGDASDHWGTVRAYLPRFLTELN